MDGDRLAVRNATIWQKYVMGATQDELAREYELSQSRISLIISEVRDSIPQQTREEIIQEGVERLRLLRRAANAVMDEAYDPKTTLDAIGVQLRIEERVAKLLGLDAATKLEHTVSGDELAAAEELARTAAARVAGGGTP